MVEPRWHGSVGFELGDRTDGTHCGYIGLAYPCDSLEDGYQKGLEWLRDFGKKRFHLLYSWRLEVRYF